MHGNKIAIPNDLRSLYWGQRDRIEDIADKYEVSKATVYNWFDEEGIEVRTRRSKFYVPFGGDVEHVFELLERRDDLFVRCVVENGWKAYNIFYKDGSVCVSKSNTDYHKNENEKYIQSLIDSYDARLCYTEDYCLYNGDKP